MGNHVASRHAHLVHAVKHEVIKLEDHHRGRDLKCFCPVDRTKRESRAHRCVIFQQFALLKHYADTDLTAPNVDLSELTAANTLAALGAILDEETDGETLVHSSDWTSPGDDDQVPDMELALFLQQTMVGNSVKPFEAGPLAPLFLDLPSYRRKFK